MSIQSESLFVSNFNGEVPNLSCLSSFFFHPILFVAAFSLIFDVFGAFSCLPLRSLASMHFTEVLAFMRTGDRIRSALHTYSLQRVHYNVRSGAIERAKDNNAGNQSKRAFLRWPLNRRTLISRLLPFIKNDNLLLILQCLSGFSAAYFT